MIRLLVTVLFIAAAAAHPSSTMTHLAWACTIASLAEAAGALVGRWLK